MIKGVEMLNNPIIISQGIHVLDNHLFLYLQRLNTALLINVNLWSSLNKLSMKHLPHDPITCESVIYSSVECNL